jgi:beta-lactamase domain protein
MFTGDAEDAEEEEILAHTPPERLRSTLLKVGHHGSKTSSTPAFLQAVDPGVGLISCGFPSKYWHPHKSTRTALRKRGIDVYSTPVNGMITIVSDGKTYDIRPEKGEKNDFGIYEKREKEEHKEEKGAGRKK